MHWLSTHGFSSRGSESKIIIIASVINSNISISTSHSHSSVPQVFQIPPEPQVQPQQSDPSQPQAPQQAPQTQPQQPVQVRRRIRTKSKPQDSSEIAAVLQDIKENHLPYHSGSDQRRSSGSSVRRRVASRSHSSGMVSRGSSGIFSRSDQGSNHKRAQADWTSWS